MFRYQVIRWLLCQVCVFKFSKNDIVFVFKPAVWNTNKTRKTVTVKQNKNTGKTINTGRTVNTGETVNIGGTVNTVIVIGKFQ